MPCLPADNASFFRFSRDPGRHLGLEPGVVALQRLQRCFPEFLEGICHALGPFVKICSAQCKPQHMQGLALSDDSLYSIRVKSVWPSC